MLKDILEVFESSVEKEILLINFTIIGNWSEQSFGSNKNIIFWNLILNGVILIDHLIHFRTLAQHGINFVNIHADGDIVPSPYLSLVIGNIRKHSLQKYWDRGLAGLWELKLVKEIAEKVVSIADMGKRRENLPMVWFDENIKVDFIDEGLYKQLEKEGN